MRSVLLGALLLVTAACGAYQFPGGPPSPATGKIAGKVTSVLCAPIQPAQGQGACTKRPVPGLEISFTAGQSVSRTTTDSQGTYSIELPPGTYQVKLKTYMRVVGGPLELKVAAGATTTANYVLDTGIRAPTA